VSTDIDANRTFVTDQAGKQRISKTNALGQLTDVYEIMAASDASTSSVTFPNTSIAYGYVTSYAYDTLNNLTTVNQGAQTRTFTYNSLSRLLSAANPESGTISYGYDPNGNLTSKVDARSITTSYVYDALNRVTDRNYTNEPSGSETPDVDYFYGTTAPKVGKLTKVSSSVSTTEYTSFDILGRVTASKQTTDGVEYGGSGSPAAMTYTYNLGGAMIEQQYPSGRVVKNTLDASGDLAMIASKENSSAIFKTYVNDFTYNAAGAVTSLKLGNGKFESTQFNSRLQPTQIALGASVGDTGSLKLDYEYGATATVNNGNVTKQTITVPGMTYPLIQNYTYDSLNRLDDASETSNGTQTWRQDFSFDRYGNRNFVESNTSFAGFDKLCNSNTELCATLRKQLNPGINSGNNNRMNSGQDYTYDSAGNTLTDANGQTFIYDGENKQVEVRNSSNAAIGKYWYDGDGKRVKKEVPGTGEVTVFVYDAAGKQIAEYSTVVASANDAKVAYLTADHLGSPRINTDVIGAVTSRHDYHPFGEEIATSQRTSGVGYAGDTVRKQFTGYERDTETDLDFAQARMHDLNLGRFTSPDPAMVSASDINPQTWNRYIYVVNNPLKYSDPLGLWKIVGAEAIEEKYEEEVDGKKVEKTRIIGYKVVLYKEDGDDLKSLAKQLNIKEKDAAKYFGAADADGNIRLSDVNGTIGNVFEAIEDRISDHEKAKARNPGKGDDQDWDCSLTSSTLAGRPTRGYDELDAIVGAGLTNGGAINVGQKDVKTGDMLRFVKPGTKEAHHWATFLIFNKTGEPFVFSKSGMSGPNEFGTTKQIQSRNGYGEVQAHPQNGAAKTGFYRF
jgi:RHS repeat-associated protein